MASFRIIVRFGRLLTQAPIVYSRPITVCLRLKLRKRDALSSPLGESLFSLPNMQRDSRFFYVICEECYLPSFIKQCFSRPASRTSPKHDCVFIVFRMKMKVPIWRANRDHLWSDFRHLFELLFPKIFTNRRYFQVFRGHIREFSWGAEWNRTLNICDKAVMQGIWTMHDLRALIVRPILCLSRMAMYGHEIRHDTKSSTFQSMPRQGGVTHT